MKLTFDDGPSVWTLPIANRLHLSKVRAMFFVVGSCVNKHPGIVEKIVALGHRVGNHSHYHADPLRLTAADAEHDRQLCNQALAAVGVHNPPYRPPYGHPWAWPRELDVWSWDVLPGDWVPGFNAQGAFADSALWHGVVALHDGPDPHEAPRSAPSRFQTERLVELLCDAHDHYQRVLESV